jgi:hypothetical protein
MTQTNAPAAKKGGCPVGCIILGVVLVLLIVVAAGVAAFLVFAAPKPVAILTNISSPADGYLAEINVPLTVQAVAQHPAGIVRVEVYADGALALAQNSAAPDGSNPFVLFQSWAPLTTGRHMLTARAYTRDGQFGDSSIVNVDVVTLRYPTVDLPVDLIPHSGSTLPNLTDVSTGTGITIPRLLGANPGLSGTDPSTPLTPGTDVHIPRSPAPPPVPGPGSDSSGGSPPPLPEAPTAPTSLSANAGCSSVALIWDDSPNEEQYVVYRHAPGESGFSRVGPTLAMNTTSYSDPISTPGVYQYRVAAVRRGLEARVEVTARTPDSCRPAAPPATPDLLLTFISIDTVTRYPGIYCYITVDGRAEHVPSGDFNRLLHDADGLHYDMRLLDNRGQIVLTHHDTDPVTLSGDCYGDASIPGSGESGGGVWREDWLGHFAVTHPASDWDGRVREFAIAGDRTFRFRYSLGRRGAATIGTSDPGEIEVATPPRVEYLDMPVPTHVGYTNPLGGLCSDPRLCPINVVWSWAGNDFFTDDSLTGYRMAVKLTDLTVATHPTRELGRWDVPGGRSRSVPLPTLPTDIVCGARYDFVVLAYQLDPVSGIIRESRWSEPFQWFLRDCPHEADVRVTVEKLVFGPPRGATDIRDNEHCGFPGCIDNRLEVSGFVQIYGLNVMTGHSVLPSFVWPGGACPPGLFCTGLGGYGVAGATHTPWDIDMTTMVRPDSGIWANVALYDNNFLASPDPVCIGNLEFPRRTAVQWLATDESREFTSDYGEGSCRVVIRVRGVPRP